MNRRRATAFIPLFLKKMILREYIRQKYGVRFHRSVSVSRDTVFEGRNVVEQGCDVGGAFIGLGTYIASNAQLPATRIGRFCSIGQCVQTFLGRHPTGLFVSTHPAFFSPGAQAGFTFTGEQLFDEHAYVDAEGKYVVEIGNDVWIGNHARIMDGVRIGDGAVIGLGSVVTRDVEAYSINAGVPSRGIGYRFTPDQISFLLSFKWWERDFEWIKENSRMFSDIELFMKNAPILNAQNEVRS
ncbi:MAG: CatB-related O-acetyltransferase [bacterium]